MNVFVVTTTTLSTIIIPDVNALLSQCLYIDTIAHARGNVLIIIRELELIIKMYVVIKFGVHNNNYYYMKAPQVLMPRWRCHI